MLSACNYRVEICIEMIKSLTAKIYRATYVSKVNNMRKSSIIIFHSQSKSILLQLEVRMEKLLLAIINGGGGFLRMQKSKYIHKLTIQLNFFLV